ncbi:HAD superfamily hydrolase (TIGR01509 family) [Pseudomonas sp. LP_7_YM]|nr:HAD superfamily hydrolase (TIGR01509 family) [Pseudomonas sp. LP_7_YM]
MDGVLIQSREVIERAWTGVAHEYGITVSEKFIKDHIHGRPGEYTLRTLFGDFDPSQRYNIKQQVDAAEENALCKLVPGVSRLIDQLRESKVPLALVTSSWPERIDNVLQQHGLEGAFDYVISREDVPNGKPSPECYELAAEKLNCQSRQCLVFEDSSSGVRSAVSSGALCLGIGTDPSLLVEGAAAVYVDFNALPVVSRPVIKNVFDGSSLMLSSHITKRLL